METIRTHPELPERVDFFLRGTYLGIRALCRRFEAEWDGPDAPPLGRNWAEELINVRLLKAAHRQSMADHLREMMEEAD